MKVKAIRGYIITPYGLKLAYDSAAKKQAAPEKYEEITIVAETQPQATATGKKKTNTIELALAGPKEGKLEHAKNLLGKELKLADIFKEGQYIDVHSVTKGKGFQGTVKRFGVKIRHHKSEKTKRGIGTLGPWIPRHVSWKVPQSGKMGYHTRTEFNKLVVKLNPKPEEVNAKGGLLHYGKIKNDCILIKGSVPGPVKREIVITDAIRPMRKEFVPEIVMISTASKQ